MPRRRRKKREKWVPLGQDFIGRQQVPHEVYHNAKARELAQFDQMAEGEYKELVREFGMSGAKEEFRRRQREATQRAMEDDRAQAIKEGRIW